MSGNEYDANRSNKRSEEEIVALLLTGMHTVECSVTHLLLASKAPRNAHLILALALAKPPLVERGLTLKLFRDSVSLVWGSLVKALALLLPQPAPQARCLRCAAPQVRVAPSLQASASATPENATPAK